MTKPIRTTHLMSLLSAAVSADLTPEQVAAERDPEPVLPDDVDQLWLLEARAEAWQRAAGQAVAWIRQALADKIGTNPIRLGDAIYQTGIDRTPTIRDPEAFWDWLLYDDGARPEHVKMVLPERDFRKTGIIGVERQRISQRDHLDGAAPDDENIEARSRRKADELIVYKSKCVCGHQEDPDHTDAGEAVGCTQCDACEAFDPKRTLTKTPTSKVKTKWAQALTNHGDRRYK